MKMNTNLFLSLVATAILFVSCSTDDTADIIINDNSVTNNNNGGGTTECSFINQEGTHKKESPTK